MQPIPTDITCPHRTALGVALGAPPICDKCRDDSATYGAQDAAVDYMARVSVRRRPVRRDGPGQRSRGVRRG